MPGLLADENFPWPVTRLLRERGYDIVTLADLGRTNQKLDDAAVLRLATESGRVVLTLDRWDFTRLHRDSVLHAGIITCTPDAPDALAERLDVALSEIQSWSRRLVRVRRDRTEHETSGA